MTTFSAAGQPLAQPPDRRLAGYNDPTTRWQPGEVVVGHIPATAWLGDAPAAGNYRFTLRVYDAAAPGAPLTTPAGAVQLELGPVEVEID